METPRPAGREPALLRHLPAISAGGKLPWWRLGEWPTPVERLPALEPFVGGGPLYVKRDDLAAQRCGGNKVRALEPVLGALRARGVAKLWTSGAYGSNHALTTALLAPEAGLRVGVLLYPQPPSEAARATLLATLASGPEVRALWSFMAAPFCGRIASGPDEAYLPPGGATPLGALGFASAALELAEQIRDGVLPLPARVVVAMGTGGTAAGLLAGMALAVRLGLIARASVPEIWAVRVVPWPVASAWSAARLGAGAASLLATAAGDPSLIEARARLARPLCVLGGHLGRGYGYPTAEAGAAIARFRDAGGPPLDPVYSGKAAAGLLAHPAPGPVLFWATKSSRTLPAPDPAATATAPAPIRRWLERTAR